jgi:hypothetical protein
MKRSYFHISLPTFIILTGAGIAFATVAWAAYDPGQVGAAAAQGLNQGLSAGTQGTATTLAQLLSRATIGDKNALCVASSVYSLFKGGLDNKLKQISAMGEQLLSSAATNALSTAVSCGISSLVNKGLGKIPGIGSLLGGAGGPDCVQTVKSDTLGYLKAGLNQAKQELFLTRCSVASTLKVIGDDVDAMIQTQGPGGGAAWAQDWTTSAYIEPDAIAHRRFWSELVNTKICGYFKDYVLNYFDVPQEYRDNPPVINSMDLRTNADAPFTLSAACTLPDDYQPSSTSDVAGFLAMGGYDFLAQLAEPQNNPQDFINLAEAELAAQENVMVNSANNQLIAGGGSLPVYRDAANCQQAPNNAGCISYGTIAIPPGSVRDTRNITLQSQLNLVSTTGANGGTDTGVGDLGTGIEARMFDLANNPLPFQFSLGIADNPANYTPTPTPAPASGSGAPNDPACTGGNPQCTCIKNDASAQTLASTTLKTTMQSVLTANPSLFTPNSNQLATGVDNRTVLQAICAQISTSACIPHPTKDNMIVLIAGETAMSFEVITAGGSLRTDGGSPVLAWMSGVQN